MQNKTPKFSLGKTVITPGALEVLQQSGQNPSDYLRRHQSGDWGETCVEDAQRNDEAIMHEGDEDKQERILSVYKTLSNDTIWIITEWDRSATTILLPDEY